MVSPVINCPYCQKEIKLNESLAAPLLEATKKEYEERLAEKDTEVGRREAAVRKQEQAVEAAQKQIEDQVTERARAERQKIALEEAKKARLSVSDELSAKTRFAGHLEDEGRQTSGSAAGSRRADQETAGTR